MENRDDTVFTRRLRLELLDRRHVDALFEGLCAPELYEFIPQEPPKTEQELALRIERVLRGSSSTNELWINWVVYNRESGACIGLIECTVLEKRTAWLAYFIFKPFWRQGFCRDACSGLIRHITAQHAIGTFIGGQPRVSR